MTFPKARLAVAACLFIGWLLFLAFLVFNARTVILSKPQFLIAQAYVVVQAKQSGNRADPNVEVVETLWTARPIADQLTIPELAGMSNAQGFAGPGKYLLPLVRINDSWHVAPLPRMDPRTSYTASLATHGTVETSGIFSHRIASRLPIHDAVALKGEWEQLGYKQVRVHPEELRIYPWNADARAQVEELIAAKKAP